MKNNGSINKHKFNINNGEQELLGNQKNLIEDFQENILDNIDDAIFFHYYDNNMLGKIINVNKEACERLGYSKTELLNMTPDDIDSYEYNNSYHKEKVLMDLNNEGKVIFEAEHVTKTGNIIPVEISSKVIKNNNKKMVLSVCRDITKRKNVERKLKEFKNLYQSSLDSLAANIVVLDKKGTIRYKNKAWDDFAKNNGLSPKKCGIGINYLEACENAEDKESKEALTALQGIKDVMAGNKDLFFMEYPCHSPDIKRWYEMKVTPFQGEGPYSVVIIHTDITERKLNELELKKERKRIEYLSFHDDLTGLYNRRYFENEINRLNKSRKVPISIIMGDMDGLKYLNDNYGHKIGDKYLKKVGETVNFATRSEDIVARVGGDEFAVILPDTDVDICEEICERIMNKCNEIELKKIFPEPIKISLGCSTMKKECQDLNKIYIEADQKMYKNKGRRRKFFE